MKHQTTREHFEKYRDMAEAAHVTLRNNTAFGTKEKIARLYGADPILNNIPLYKFDGYFVYTRYLAGGPRSLAENTCLYKHLLVYEVLGCVPVFVEKGKKDTISEEYDDRYPEGFNAFGRGKVWRDCPYDLGSSARETWILGWEDAEDAAYHRGKPEETS